MNARLSAVAALFGLIAATAQAGSALEDGSIFAPLQMFQECDVCP